MTLDPRLAVRRDHARHASGIALALIVVIAGTSVEISTASVHTTAATAESRVTSGLLSLYTFEEGSGSIVHDVSGVGTPVNLSIRTPAATSWRERGLAVESPTLISSLEPATKIITRVRETEAVTVEAWVRPKTISQGGPARIAALSGGATGINVALDQGRADGFTSRMRSTVTDSAGAAMSSSGDAAKTPPIHLVYTRGAFGHQRLYVNGQLRKEKMLYGGLGNWDASHRLVLASDLDNTKSWLGKYRLLALYDRALTQSDVAVNFAAGPSAATTAPTPTPETPSKLLIKYGQDIPSPAQFAANRSLYESRPFDGWVLHMPTYSAGVFSSTPYSQAQFAAEIAKFPAGLTRSTHNWLRLIMVNPIDFNNDEQWRIINSNARNLAAAIAASGRQIDGVFIDNEWYGSGASPWNYGTTSTPWDGAATGSAAVNKRDLTRERGRQFMNAIAAGWSSAKVMALYGPWVGESKTYNAISGLAYNDVAWANELMGTFAYGVAQSTISNQVRLIDGGEVYGARTASDFATLRNWQQTGFADSGSVIVSPGEASSYKRAISSSVGVYDRDNRNGYTLFSAASLANLTMLALDSVDQYAWLYTETHEWGASQSGKPTVPQTYLEAMAKVRNSQ